MPCYQSSNVPSGYGKIGTGGYATEAECLQACKEGACCNGTTCSVKPQCQCDAAAGEVFNGIGTVCSPNPCGDCICPSPQQNAMLPESLVLTFSAGSLSPRADQLTSPAGTHPAGADQIAASLLSGLSLVVSKSQSWDYQSFGRRFCQNAQGGNADCCSFSQTQTGGVSACVLSSLPCSGQFSGSLSSPQFCEGSFFQIFQTMTQQELDASCASCTANSGSPISRAESIVLSTTLGGLVPFAASLGNACDGQMQAVTIPLSPQSAPQNEFFVYINVSMVPGCPRTYIPPQGIVAGYLNYFWAYTVSDLSMTVTPVYANPLP